MRILSGELKSRKILSPSDFASAKPGRSHPHYSDILNSHPTHPMGSRERLALFNQIRHYFSSLTPTSSAPQISLSVYAKPQVSPILPLQYLRVLDAYAGSGALGLESLSLGAESVLFIDSSPLAQLAIKKNLEQLNLTTRAKIYPYPVQNFKSQELFDLIFIDPPYTSFSLQEFQPLFKLLSPKGLLVISHPSPLPNFTDFTLLSSKKYARAMISLFVKSC